MGVVTVNVINSLSFFVSAFIISGKTEKRKLFWVRYLLCYAIFVGLRYLFFDFIPQRIQDVAWLTVFNLFSCIVLIVLICLTIFVSYKTNFWVILFCGNVCYTFSDFCRKTYHLIAGLWLKNAPEVAHVFLFLGIIITMSAVLYIIMRRLGLKRIVVNNKYLLFISLVLIASVIILNIFSLRALSVGETDAVRNYINAIFIIVTLLILCLNFGMVSSRELEIERDKIKEILKEKQEQYYYEKSMIDIINVKCHDLKHQLANLSGNSGEKAVEEARAVVEAYDSSFYTGNTALDVILTRKAFSCRGKDIELTCAVNGKCIDFISEVDVYSLFGNILDNAIEATEKLEDKTKRVISLSIEKNGYFVTVSAQNYFAGKLIFENGNPLSTKGDSVNHGFGVKSIRMIAEKYNGNLVINTVGDRFILDIMFNV